VEVSVEVAGAVGVAVPVGVAGAVGVPLVLVAGVDGVTEGLGVAFSGW
jgi:hypothetical protein